MLLFDTVTLCGLGCQFRKLKIKASIFAIKHLAFTYTLADVIFAKAKVCYLKLDNIYWTLNLHTLSSN